VHAECKRTTNVHEHHYITCVTPQLSAAVLTLTFIAKRPGLFGTWLHNHTSVSDSIPYSISHVRQELQAKVAPVLAKWRNKLLAAALEAFQENVASAEDKRQQVQRVLRYWNNRALAGAFAQWLQTVEVGHGSAAKLASLQQN